MVKSPDERSVLPVARGPFTRLLRVHEVPAKAGLDRTIEATPAECAAIAADGGLPAVASLKAVVHVASRPGGRFEVTGTVEAVLTQVCVVTLEPFESTLRHAIEMSFALPPPREAQSRSERVRLAVVDIDAEDDSPDPIVDNTIDLGAVALEFLTLARDFYPKKPGVHFTDVLIGEKEEAEPSPFAALERFKDQT